MRTDPPRNETRKRCLVRFNPEGARHVMAGTNLIQRRSDDAPTEVTLYDSDVEALKAYVETAPLLVEQARGVYLRETAIFAAERLGVTAEHLQGPKETISAAHLEELERVRRTTGDSVEGQFHKLTRRGIMPLLSIDVVEALPPPATDEELSAARLLQMFQSLNLIPNQQSAQQTDVMKLLEKLTSDNAAMAKRLDDYESKNKKG